jgi:hypothetical protein
MRRLVAAMVLGLGLLSSVPASAYLVEVTTSVAIEDIDDPLQLQSAIRGAVDDVLQEAIAFTPTVVILTHTAVVGDRLYLRLLLADQEGERTFEALQGSPDLEPAAATDLRI